MNLLKKLPSIFAGALLVAALAAGVAVADPYQYTVTLYSGDAADFASGDSVTYTAKKGDSVTLDASGIVMPEDSKYYAKGVRLAGANSDQSQPSMTVKVTEDADYVVAYGLKKTVVSYTVNIVDAANGNTLKSVTHQGNVGDRPVMSYVYVENYLPPAWNVTLPTLQSGSNAFTVQYTHVPEGTTTVITDNTGDNGGNNGNAGNGGEGNAVVNGGEGNAPVAVVDANGNPVLDANGNPVVNGVPNETVIEDPQTPLAGPTDGKTGSDNQKKAGIDPFMIILGIGVLAAIAVLAIAFTRRGKDQAE